MADPTDKQLERFARTATPATMTATNGSPIDSLTASMTAGPRGPIVLQDFPLIDHLARFSRERIPERVVHAKGAGAFGEFVVTSPEIQRYCRADFLSEVGKRTEVAVRFSTVGGESGSADTVRDPRGFAVKFYTNEGVWDCVGNNTPIFFLRDPALFPSFIHTQKRNPATHSKDATMVWDMFSLRPETTHQVTVLFSDRGIPDGYRHMNGYGSHTFKLVNNEGQPVYCKWHFKCDQGIRNLTVDEAGRLASSDPDYAIRDLYNAIEEGAFPSWTLYVQIMTYEQAEAHPDNPFDVTKVWPHSQFPLIEVGRMTLNRNPTDYFAEVEQIAFAPAHMVPGIEPSPDKMLQGRLFSYTDTHRHRLGANYEQLPVNRPLSSAVYGRDGPMTYDIPKGAPNYFPNSFGGPQPAAEAAWHADRATGDVQRYSTADDDNFTQAGLLYRKVLSAAERERLTDNIAGSLAGVPEFIQKRAIANFAAADAGYGAAVERKVARIRGAQGAAPRAAPRAPAPLNPPRHVPRPVAAKGPRL